ncbi:hypothetical protein [Clostridium intestinale]|uniref:Uncharacterized protein n=1 Tax=Clostridium intestinale DSM 6191 TaxID=1121320 RepID=A0A1M6AKA7_9CLOT|nr:hypothetical protein [Clostridium intestinale]SHI36896.1 hypothetical protein SAMN02745941_03687 [Clostridium intestinale DSM 6191]
MENEIEFLKLADWERDEIALERFKRKMKNIGKEIKVINSKKVCSKLMKIYFVEVNCNGMQKVD